MAIYTELPIYKHGCDLLALALDAQVNMKREFKRPLGDKIFALCTDMLEAMAMANASRGEDRLAQIELLLKYLRATTAMMRVAHDAHQVSHNLWAKSIELLNAVGAMAGGWKNQTLSTLKTAPAA